MKKIWKIWKNRIYFRYIFSTIYFNFKYLPPNQALKLPIILYKPHFITLKGKFLIVSENIKFGMIKLGFPEVSIYPNTGIVIENHGGECTFNGACQIGNASAISIGKAGQLNIGSNFKATANLKLICYHYIEFKDRVAISWETIIIDTDLHNMVKLDGTQTKGYGCIFIGSDNWIGFRCTILKNAKTPNYCTVGANTVLNKAFLDEYTVIAGNPVIIKTSGLYHNIYNNTINYIKYLP